MPYNACTDMTHLHSRRQALAWGAAAALAPALAPSPSRAQSGSLPAAIRIGAPELGSGGKGFPGATALSVAKARGWLEEEFARDGIKVEWTLFRGAGPAVNEALSARQLDVVFLGDLAAVIGRSRNLPTRLIAVTARESASYLAAAPGSGIKGFADLKGRKVAVLKGTAYQRPFDALLAEAGLSEKDVRLVNMDWPTAKAAVVARDVDATFGGADLHLLLDKGVSLPVSTKGRGPAFQIHSSLLATEDFLGRHPAVAQRLVRQVVRAAHWASQDANRGALATLWGDLSGQGPAVFQADLDGANLRSHFSPHVDEEAVAGYKAVVADALKLGLIKAPVDVDAWVAPAWVQAAVKDLKLDSAWPRLDARGKAVSA